MTTTRQREFNAALDTYIYGYRRTRRVAAQPPKRRTGLTGLLRIAATKFLSALSVSEHPLG
jgi:hypothetical protein